MSKPTETFFILVTLFTIVVGVFVSPAWSRTAPGQPEMGNSNEPSFSLAQLFDNLKFVEVKDNKTEEAINVPAPARYLQFFVAVLPTLQFRLF